MSAIRTASPRVRIVADCSTFRPPFTAGGTERQLSDLARQLELDDIDVAVIVRECPGPEAPVAAPETAETASSARPPRTVYVGPAPVAKGLGWAALGPNLRFISGTLRVLLRTRREYDVLIISGFRQLALPMTVLSCLLRKQSIVRIEAAWDLHDELTPESNARIGSAAKHLASILIRATRRMTFRLADAIVAFSDPLEQRLLELGAPAAKVKQIPNGVDTTRFAPVTAAEKAALRMKLGLPAGRPIFVYTGRICRAKGLLELMQTWERLSPTDEPYLLLIGSGMRSHESCEEEVRETAARHPGSIDWRGEVENVAEYLQASDVFIFLSYFESCSLSVLEAASVGLPCLLTDVGCARQIVTHRDSGAIVPARAAVETVLREIAWLLSRRHDWSEIGGRARARVVSGYGLEPVATRYVQLCNTRR